VRLRRHHGWAGASRGRAEGHRHGVRPGNERRRCHGAPARSGAAETTSVNLFQLLNSLTFAALLFVVASGFTLIFGLLRIVNLAHGALYLLGGYIGYGIAVHTGYFVLGGVGAMAAVAAVGLALDRGLLRFVRGYELRQVLL